MLIGAVVRGLVCLKKDIFIVKLLSHTFHCGGMP